MKFKIIDMHQFAKEARKEKVIERINLRTRTHMMIDDGILGIGSASRQNALFHVITLGEEQAMRKPIDREWLIKMVEEWYED